MKRILGMVVATAAVLAYSTVASATSVIFDVSGVVGAWSRSGDPLAGNPPNAATGGHCGASGLASSTPGSAVNCFRYVFAPGSSVEVDISGTSVTMIGGTLNVIASTAIVGGTIVLATNGTTTIAGGATGTLSGDSILWSSAANSSSTGTITCTGANCALISLPVGIPVPLQPTLSALTNTTPVTALNLGQWDLNGAHTAILASTTAVTAWSNVIEDGNRRQAAFTFGPTLLGLPVPEPGAAALVLLGLGALALRSRKA